MENNGGAFDSGGLLVRGGIPREIIDREIDISQHSLAKCFIINRNYHFRLVHCGISMFISTE